MREEMRVMLALSIHSGAESEALGVAYRVLGIFRAGAETRAFV